MSLTFAPLFSGSSGNALLVIRDDTRVLVDAGLPGKKIAEEMERAGEKAEALSAIFVTHEHLDHIAGVGVLARRYGLPVYATEPTWRAMRPKIGKIQPEQERYVEPGGSIRCGAIEARAFSIPHDAACPVGYSFLGGGRKISIATDIGCLREDWMDAVAESDMLLLESNHDVDMLRAGMYPYELKMRILGNAGHLSNDDAGIAAAALCARGVRSILLGHLSGENNFPELAWESVACKLREIGGMGDIPLGVAMRGGFSGRYDFEERAAISLPRVV